MVCFWSPGLKNGIETDRTEPKNGPVTAKKRKPSILSTQWFRSPLTRSCSWVPIPSITKIATAFIYSSDESRLYRFSLQCFIHSWTSKGTLCHLLTSVLLTKLRNIKFIHDVDWNRLVELERALQRAKNFIQLQQSFFIIVVGTIDLVFTSYYQERE